MKDLIERLENATGPDRELDVAIVYALYPNIGPYQPMCIGDDPIFWHDPYRKQEAPHFTESIDAALTLVPSDCAWSLRVDEACVWRVENFEVFASIENFRPLPAIVMCIAALRARQP